MKNKEILVRGHNRRAARRNGRKTAWIVLAVVVMFVGTIAVASYKGLASAGDSGDTTENAKPFIVFDSSKAADWYLGPGDKKSQLVFRNGGNCFVMLVAEDGALNENELLRNKQEAATSLGVVFSTGDTLPLTLNTVSGDTKEYRLHQFTNDTSASSGDVFSEEAIGYAELESGFVRVETYCNPKEGLSNPVQALQAVKLNI